MSQEYDVNIPETSLTDALARLAQYFNKELSGDQLFDTEVGGAPVSFQRAGRLLAKVGLSATHSTVDSVDSLDSPCCVALENGKFLTIFYQKDQYFCVADNKTDTGIKEISKASLEEVFSGSVLFVSKSLEGIQTELVSRPKEGHWFWREIKQQKGLFRDAVIGSLCANMLAACIALFSLQIYDRVIPHQSTATLWALVAGVVGAILLETMLRISRAHLLDASGRQLELRLSEFLYEKFIRARLSPQSMDPGAKVHAVKEFGSVREFFTAASIGSAADIPFSIVFLVLIYIIAGNLAFIILFAMALIVMPSLLSQKKIASLSEEMLGGSSAAGKALIESAYGQDSIKSCQAEGYYQKKWEDICALNAEKTTEQRVLSAGLTYSAQAIQQTAYVVAITAGVFLVFSGDFTVGSMIAVSILSTRTLSPVTQLSSILSRWQQVKASMTALDEIVEADQDYPQDRKFLRRPVLNGGIKVENLKFQYQEEKLVLNIPQLMFSPGEKVALLGANGSGKTTLLKVLSGLYQTEGGVLTIDGLDVNQIDPRDIRQNIGYFPQEVKLFAGTLRDNLTFGENRWDEAFLLEAIEFAGLSNFLSSDPYGLDRVIGDGGVGFSLGQRQCIGLARLYLQDPKVVLLDEPTASLDQGLEVKVIASFSTWLKGRTCIMTTHRVQPLNLVDRIIVLQDGQLVLDDKRDAALKKLGATPDAVKNDVNQEKEGPDVAA